MRTRPLALLLTLGLALLGACGGDDDEDTAATTTAAAADSEADGETTTTAGDDGDDGNAGAENDSEFCQKARVLDETGNEAFLEGETPEEIKAGFEETEQAVDELIDEAPDEVKTDLETLQRYIGQLGDVLERNGYDLQKLSTDAEALAIFENNTELTEAGDRVNAFFESECGIDSDGTDDTTDTSGDATTSTQG